MADAEAVVRELVAQVVAERGLAGPVAVRALSSGGGNFTSALFTVSIGDFKAFAKVAIIGEKMRVAMKADVLFKTEQFFYNKLVKVYNELLAKNEAAKPFRFPEMYACLPDLGRESVVIEDLSAQGYRTPSRHDPIDWRFASAAVTKLAAFHALSFAYEKENPKEFAAIAARLKYKSNLIPDNEEMMKAAWSKMIGGAIQVAKEEHKQKLTKLLTEMEGFSKFKSPISRTVIAHGDYRNSNLMFKEHESCLDIVVIDYQTLHSGSPVSDLLYFIFLGTDQQFRRRHYEELLELYHRELCSALGGVGLGGDEYPREMFLNDVKELLPAALHMSVVMLPIVTVDEAAAPKVAGDGDIDQFAVTPNKLFAQRFSDIVTDCDAWGAL